MTAGAEARKRPPTVPPPLTNPQPAPSPSAFEGDGMWIWYVNQSSGGTAASIAQRAQASGIGTLFIKSSDGRKYWSQFNSKFVRTLKSYGLHVCGWQYVYGRNPSTEAKVGGMAARNGAECLVIDAEAEYEGRYAAASTYIRKLRAYAGADFPIGLAGFPYVDYHPGYPYSVFLGPGGAQFNVPQMYWKAIGVSVDRIYSHTYTYNEIYGRPIFPLGQTYMAPRRSEILRFRDMASAYGATGISWWSWQATTTSGWSTLATQQTPVNAATSPTPVAPTLGRGSRGDMVVWAQQHLLAARKKVSVNGVFDSRTLSAVKSFQRSGGLQVTGRIDVATWQALLSHPAAKVAWRRGGGSSRVTAAGLSRPEPASARIPARMYEIPPKKH